MINCADGSFGTIVANRSFGTIVTNGSFHFTIMGAIGSNGCLQSPMVIVIAIGATDRIAIGSFGEPFDPLKLPIVANGDTFANIRTGPSIKIWGGATLKKSIPTLKLPECT